MSKTIILLRQPQNENKLQKISEEALYQHSFFEYFMNSSLKLSLEETTSILDKHCLSLSECFIKNTGSFTEILLLNFEMSLEDSKKNEFCKINNSKDKLAYMFKYSILKYQDDIKYKGFPTALADNEDFYLIADSHYKLLDTSTVINIMETGELCESK